MKIPILYPITDRALARGRSHAEIVKLLVEGGATLVQVREKGMSDRDLLMEIRSCVAIPRARIVVNDRPDLARLAKAAGAHVGEEDLPAPEARAFLGRRAILGVSTHSVEEALAACALDVDYVALGPIYETGSASVRRPPLGARAIEEAAARKMTKPLVAIGGITLARAPEVLAAGAASLAIISDLMSATDLPKRVRDYLSLGSERSRKDATGG